MRSMFPVVFLILLAPQIVSSQPTTTIRNLKASFHPTTNSIAVEWTSQAQPDATFTVRYRTVNVNSDWHYARSREPRVRLNMEDIQNNDQLEVQVKADSHDPQHDTWSQTLHITIEKQVMVGGLALSGDQLLPPLDFTAHILSSRQVKLQWRPSDHRSDIFYVVSVKQLSSRDASQQQMGACATHNYVGCKKRVKIKTSANSFTLGNLDPGHRYEMTIRSATAENNMSGTAAIVEINMPYDEEFFDIGKLLITSHFHTNGVGTVSLSWDVPHHMKPRIKGYDVKYAPRGTDQWQQIQFNGAASSAQLDNLKSNTEYQLKIKTILDNNIVTESVQFKFKTPQVTVSPISKVDVIYSHDVNSVRLQWMLEQHIDASRVAGYDVYLSENKDLPESQWKLTRLNTPEAALSLADLKSSTTYFVRVNVRNVDGSEIKAPVIFTFKTIDNEDDNVIDDESANTLSYVNVAPGEVVLKWSFLASIRRLVTGSMVVYTDRKELQQEHWSKVTIESNNNTVHLRGLNLGAKYTVHIIPRLRDGSFPRHFQESLEMKTDYVELKSADSEFRHPVKVLSHRPRFENLLMARRDSIRIQSCDPYANESDCSSNEICITRTESDDGWCIPNEIKESIINSLR